MKNLNGILLAGGIILSLISCNENASSTSQESKKDSTSAMVPQIKTESVSYSDAGVALNGFVAYDSSSVAKRPIVLVVPEWWGLTDYAKSRAKQLAELGYLAMAVDMYGNGTIAVDPANAQKFSDPFYANTALGKARIDAALAKIKTYALADTNNIGAIGYCFGGGQILNAARLGDNFKGVVSFHGNLIGAPADKKLLKAQILVCHGADDQFVKPDEVALFRKQMDSIGAVYSFISYPGATHAFSNPAATEAGKKFNLPIAYNAAADSASWNEMKNFFVKVFK
jgi:dienelactone hydrolase